MEFEKSVPFKNWTTEDFQGTFDATHYLFTAGATYSIPSSIAMHFAKHLAVRELHKIGTSKAEMLSEPEMKEYMGRCFPVKEQQPSMVSSFERIDEVKDGEAREAVVIKENKTENDAQKEVPEDDESADDDKNNVGAPKFKTSKDAKYVKA